MVAVIKRKPELTLEQHEGRVQFFQKKVKKGNIE